MKRLNRSLSLLFVVSIASAASAEVTHDFAVSDCKAGTVTLIVDRPGVVHNEFPIVIPRDMTAEEKRDFIVAALPQFRSTTSGTNRFQLYSADGFETHVSLNTGDTQEFDSIACSDLVSASVAFVGHFVPFTPPPQNQPAIFSAGIVTDVGTLSAQVSAQELNFQTDGPIICQALFQRLAPRAPQYGAAINYAGDRLEVYFDPAYTVTQGGIIFGTNSESPGCTGTVITPPTPPQPCPGDVDGDGDVDLSDLSILLAHFGVAAGATRADGDLNGDGSVGLNDLSILLANFGANCDNGN
ncbi:MAG: dockerin type I domain-containing protein [Phycisphaerae bacterium]